jgi:hypothetical protein
VFGAWTKSEAFRAVHSRAGDNKPLYPDRRQFEGLIVRHPDCGLIDLSCLENDADLN